MPSPHPLTNGPLVEQAYWDSAYGAIDPCMAADGDPVRTWLESELPRAAGDRHCLELGCYPGRYLAVLGRMGYVVHGMDLTPQVDRMKEVFSSMGIRTGEFVRADVLDHHPGRTYDVVCSFGLIEHFEHWQVLIDRHIELLAPGGTLVLETPNFKGWVQWLLHRLFDGVNLRRHHPPAMDPRAWRKYVEQAGLKVSMAGHLGRFTFWHDTPLTGIHGRSRSLVLRLVNPLLARLPPGGASYAPYAVLIAHRPPG
ncbi:MAG: class I SAM-dependent methyltransferase [Flavobacteriales bacterium]|nr:class I SAM-dependent methyltransferase [Flavobacteriales bacterium]MCB0786112.1 class I SAM-dependent methyltransferase [Flavobacteriales bacterium]MCB0808358.1 class I SAM-dependent methyltransferase [Flavobacteriales bacterium]MCB0815288.1 class I SAM-dependent methyltransferase [Flavobacteriales bacterium]